MINDFDINEYNKISEIKDIDIVEPSLRFKKAQQEIDYFLYEKLIIKMQNDFPNLPFSGNTDDLFRMDEAILNNNVAVVYHEYSCYCFGEDRTRKKVIVIRRKNNITYRDFYNTMNRCKTWLECNHNSLEYIKVQNNLILKLWFGS
jgi:hypothetical protein